MGDSLRERKKLSKVVVLIPSLDSDVTLIECTKEFEEAGFETIIIVDDGSKADKKLFLGNEKHKV